MEEIIGELVKNKNTQKLQYLLDQQDDKKVVEYITGYIIRGQDPLPLIKQVLSSSLQENEKSIERCVSVFIGLIRLLQKNEINSKTAFDIVSLLLIEVNAVQPSCLAKLAQFYVDSVKTGTFNGGRTAELLPKILSLINKKEKILKDEGDIKGSELKSHVINSLCSCRWTSAVAIHMAPMFQDIQLSLEELRFVIEKICRMLAEISLPDQPAVVFQLLRLSAKGHKRLILENICKYYTSQDEENRGQSIMIDSGDLMFETTCLTTLRQIEGTAILHVTQAVKQDSELGTEFIKYLKVQQQSSSSKVISPFNLSLLLSISQLHHFEDQIFDFLKNAIITSLRDEERQRQSLWVRECYTVGVSSEDLVLEAVEHSKYDWDHVVQGLVKLGFGLLDSFGPKLLFGEIPDRQPASGHLTPAQSACQLGRRVLLNTFKAHEPVRCIILEQIFQHVVMKSTLPVTHYLDLLSDTVFSAPQLLLESCSKIQEILVNLAQLPPKSAEGLLAVIQPLLKLSPRLKDTLILVLRKALFSRQLGSRKIGALGFIMILKNFRVIGGLPSSQVSQPISLSQLQVDIHAGYNAASNEALCLEILGNLRRCFTQQADIRLNIYQGLCSVLHTNSQLMNPVLDMLLSQLKKYYEQDEDTCPPVRLESCIVTQGDQVYLAEPLAHLLCCIQECVRKSVEIVSRMQRGDEDDDDDDIEKGDAEQSQKQIQAILTSLTKRIIDAEMEDFELDKSADFSCSNSVGVKNSIYAILVLGLYDVLIEYQFEMRKYTAVTEVLQLFANHVKLSNVLRQRTASSAGKKTKSSFKTPISLLSLQCVVDLLQVIINDEDVDQGADIGMLKKHSEFFNHLLTVAVQKLGQVSHKGSCDGEVQDRDKLLPKCWSLGRLFHLYYVGCPGKESSTDQQNKKLAIQCLEGLEQVVNIASSRGVSEVLQCLLYLEKEPSDRKEQVQETEARERIHHHVIKFQHLLSTFLGEPKENQNWAEGSTLLSIIASLSSHLPSESQEYQQVYTWMLKVAMDHTLDNASTSKELLSILLKLARQTKSMPQLLRNICQDIHSQFGDTEPDCEVDDKTNLSVTKSAVCPTTGILMLVLSHIEGDLDDLEWVIRRHKADMLSSVTRASEDSLGATQVEAMDRCVCTRLGMLVNSFIELTHSAVKTKPCSQALLKALTKLYNVLTSLTKHYISMYTSKSGHMSSRFEKLVTLVGKQLTQPTYSFIIYVQAAETEVDEERKEKKRKAGPSSAQAGMANAMKQVKTIPNLIFAIEQLEKFLIQLTKKSKVNLMESMKVSTSRDFRINTEAVTTVVEQGMSSDDESEQGDNSDRAEEGREEAAGVDHSDGDSSSEQENTPTEEPPAKKKKSLSKLKNYT